VDRDVQRLLGAGLRPLFVFPGLVLARRTGSANKVWVQCGETSVARSIPLAWLSHYANMPDKARHAFEQAAERGMAICAAFSAAVLARLGELGVERMRAPYLVFPQLAWLSLQPARCGGVSAVLGGVELALCGAERVIVDIDTERGTFTWVDCVALLGHLGLTPEQFVDATVLSGCDMCKTLSALPRVSAFRSAATYVHQYGTGRNAILETLPEEAHAVRQYLVAFSRARTLIRYHPIFNPTTCAVELLNAKDAPGDLHLIHGPRLPDEAYFYLCSGAVSPSVLGSLVTGLHIDVPPVADSEEFQELLLQLVDVRAKTVAVLVATLH
jgi:hypothetical protein